MTGLFKTAQEGAEVRKGRSGLVAQRQQPQWQGVRDNSGGCDAIVAGNFEPQLIVKR
jgi:hypothetical protein